jgi:Glu-tRNA(Gln) amidotransferase subunit E-like FAD-binding protein
MDYKKLGFKAGIEIHQQLGTKHKLFCKCSASFERKEQHSDIKRKLRVVAGETGELDVAATHEFLKGKDYTYNIYPCESCLVEGDEEPPHPLNREALEAGLEAALLLNCDIPDEIHIMRKNVIDGSNTSGFQRTAIIGLNGSIPTSKGRVGIPVLLLEEESSQIIKKDKRKTIFGLNRLGIPMLEIATDSSIKDPEHAKEVAEKLGMILRSTGKMKRGIGTIRQDVNVSIAGGERTEIKGFQDLKKMPRIIEGEIKRQRDLKKKRKKIEKTVRKANPDFSTTFLRPLPGAARLYPETDIPPVTVNRPLLEKLRRSLPELLDDKIKKLETKSGLDTNTVKALEKSGMTSLFEELSKLDLKPSFIADTLISYKSFVKKKHPKSNPEKITPSHLKQIFQALNKGSISKDAVMQLLTDISLGKPLHIKEQKKSIPPTQLEKEIRELISKKPGLTFGAYMGILMGKYKGRFSGEEIAAALKKVLK